MRKTRLCFKLKSGGILSSYILVSYTIIFMTIQNKYCNILTLITKILPFNGMFQWLNFNCFYGLLYDSKS